MINILTQWLVNALVIFVAAYFLKGVYITNFTAALAAALILGIINITIRPILYFLTLPITFLTLGIFTFVINALMILLASAIVPGFVVINFWWAFVFSIILTIINYFLYQMFS
jgi:putative membrane protein